MNIFASMTAIMMDEKAHWIFLFFQCSKVVAEISDNISYNTLFEWMESSHFCLPIETSKLLGKETVKERTTYESSLKIEA